MSISDRLKYLRNEKCLSQVQFAKSIGVSSGNVGDWESGRSKPTTNALISIYKTFRISTDWLLIGEGEMYKLPIHSSEQIQDPNIKELINCICYWKRKIK